MVTCDVFDSTKRESTTPKGVASTLHLPPRVASYRRQPRAIKSTTPMGLPYHHPLITTPQRGVCSYHNMGLRAAWPFIAKPQHRDGAHHGHLSPYHNAGYGNAIMWGCVPHAHLLPSHAIEMVRIMAIYHHAIMRGVTMPSRGIVPSMAGACARKGVGEVTPKGLYF